MRVVMLWPLLLALPAAAVCWHWRVLGRPAEEAPASPDRLVLEIGGQAPSLRGVALLVGSRAQEPQARPPSEEPRPGPAGPGRDRVADRPVDDKPKDKPRDKPRPEDRKDEKPKDKPKDPEPPPAREAQRVAVVGDGETLYRIAQRELGDASRWREIAKLNQISEASVARIKAGARLQLPRR